MHFHCYKIVWGIDLKDKYPFILLYNAQKSSIYEHSVANTAMRVRHVETTVLESRLFFELCL
jgi:hypothetical protein